MRMQPVGTLLGTMARSVLSVVRKSQGRGHIEARSNGTFRAVVSAGVDPLTGRRRMLKETAHTKQAAEKALTRLLNQVDEERHPRSAITVSQAIEKWFEVAEHGRKTRRRYEQLARDYIGPELGHLQLGRLGAEQLERFYAKLKRCRERCNGQSVGHTCNGLSNSTIRQIHFMLRATSDRAVRWNYIGVNAAALAEPPTFTRPDPDPPSSAEIAAILNEAWTVPEWGMLLWLVTITGCRRGELCVLRWTDVDLDRGTLMVERASDETDEGRIEEKETKTGQKRRIGLDDYTVELLNNYRSRCAAQCRSLGIELDRKAYLFSTSPDFSLPIRPNTVSQRYRRLAVRNDLRSTRLHSLRHYSATELLNAGVDLRTVAGRLGHGSGGSTTLRFYSAWVDKVDRTAAAALAASIPRPNPSRRMARSPYERLASQLRADIESGEYSAGSELPTTLELAAMHQVAVGTVSRALGLLKAEGLVSVKRGQRATVLSTR